VIGKAQAARSMIETNTVKRDMPTTRYAYYRRCQVLRKGGEQCKAPAEKGSNICHAHAGQQAMLLRRERERQAVLAEAVAVMRRRGRPECEAKDLFTDFTGIQITLAVAAQALVDGRADCKTAGRLAWNLQTMARLLRLVHRKGHKVTTNLPQIHVEPRQVSADERRSGQESRALVLTPPKSVNRTETNQTMQYGDMDHWDTEYWAKKQCEGMRLEIENAFKRHGGWPNGPPLLVKAA
jgi:hypothetical protein